MRLATWNVNSINARLDRVLAFLKRNSPDVVCLQELKCTDDKFPWDPIAQAGYHAAVIGQKSYNGVAILSKNKLSQIQNKFGDEVLDKESRLIQAEYEDCTIISAYCPNGSEVGSSKYAYKLHWFRSLEKYLQGQLQRNKMCVVAGDFNVAPDERDVYDPLLWQGRIHFSAPERFALKKLLTLGLHDCFRKHEERAGFYSWWDYRSMNFSKDLGLRIDLILSSAELYGKSTSAWIEKSERELREGSTPSDHAPVFVHFT